MIFPFDALILEYRELGLVAAVLLGVGFGFTLERAGFGQAPNLAAQFYLTDMRVFKVMFSAIITAMLGVMLASGMGLTDLKVIAESATSFTYMWPMLVGGLLLGAGFIISGYCPGTSLVGTASGNLDALFAFCGVMLGSVLYGEVQGASAALQSFHVSGDMGHLFLHDWLGIPAPVLALLVALMALGMFLGAEKVEQLMARRSGAEVATDGAAQRSRRLAFSGIAVAAALGLATLALPTAPKAAQPRTVDRLTQADFARRLVDRPWTLRVLDLRSAKACEKKTIPGADCAPWSSLGQLGLAYTAGARDLVLLSYKSLERAPAAALAYPGRLYLLEGGWAGWKRFALTRPQPPGDLADAGARQDHAFRAALHSAMTGVKPVAPKPVGGVKYVPKKKKKKGGGCG